MLNFILRKFVFKNTSDDQFLLYILLKERILMHWLAKFFVYFFQTLPIALVLLTLVYIVTAFKGFIIDIIYIIIFLIIYMCLLIIFNKYFRKAINNFIFNIYSTLYFNNYTIKGKAIMLEDFNTIKQENSNLYFHIKNILCQGHCYSICFELLKCLKKGEIHFYATRNFDDDESSSYEFTMHVLYVNNDWCFDTFSGNQYPLKKAIKKHQAKIYKVYSYDEIKEKNYDQFRKDETKALLKWCSNNNCYVNWQS